MIVGCYSMDLYCENAEASSTVCRVGWGYHGPPVYTGRTEAECIRQARGDGWLITNDRPRKAYCPKCAKTRRKGKRATSSSPSTKSH